MPSLVASLTTTVRVIHRVHCSAPGLGPDAQPAFAAGLAKRYVRVVAVANLSDGGHARGEHHTHLARRHAQRRVLALFGHDLGRGSRRAHHLAALAGLEFDVMDLSAERDVADRHGVGRSNIHLGAGNHRVAHHEADWRQDVALFTIGIVQQGDVGGTVGVVLDGRNFRRNIELFAAEVDDSIQPLVAATAMARGYVTLVVAT